MINYFSEQCPGRSISRLVASELLPRLGDLGFFFLMINYFSEQCPGRSISRLVALELLPRLGDLGFFFLMINYFSEQCPGRSISRIASKTWQFRIFLSYDLFYYFSEQCPGDQFFFLMIFFIILVNSVQVINKSSGCFRIASKTWRFRIFLLGDTSNLKLGMYLNHNS